MDNSFGQFILSLYTLIEGKILSYGYSNLKVPNEVREFQNLFRSKLVSYIENHDMPSRKFLDLCIEHIQDILDDRFSFIQQSACKISEE